MTRNWNDMPPELKWMIVDRMDIITRFRLKMCSKNDKCLVEMVPVNRHMVTARCVTSGGRHGGFEELNFSHVAVRCTDRAITVLDRKTKEKRVIELTSRAEGQVMMKCMFRDFMSQQNYRFGQFTTNLELPDVVPRPNFKFYVNKLNLRGVLYNYKWLDIVANQPEELEIDGGFKELHSMVKNAKRLHWRIAHSTDNKTLMKLKATDLYIADSSINEEGINAYIKKMIKKNYPIGSKMEFVRHSRSNWDRLIYGLNYQEINEADNGFRCNNVLRRRVVSIPMSVEKDIIVRWRATAFDTIELSVVKREDK